MEENTFDDLIAELQSITELNPTRYQYYHQLLHNRTIVFNDSIDSDIVEKVYLPLKDFENDDSDEPITLILNSMGGSVADGFFLANYIAKYKKKLIILITGYAASMAILFLCAGGKNPNVIRKCFPSTYGLIHDGYLTLGSNESKTAADYMEFNNRIDKSIRDFILENTSITAEQYDAKTRHQWFLTAEEMKDLNIVDEIM